MLDITYAYSCTTATQLCLKPPLQILETNTGIQHFSLCLMQLLCLQEDAQLEMSATTAAEQLLAEEEQ